MPAGAAPAVYNPTRMDKIRIQGPSRLQGRVDISGAKNAVLPEMAALLLLEGPAVLRHVPAVRGGDTIARVLRQLRLPEVRLQESTLRADSGVPANPEAPGALA